MHSESEQAVVEPAEGSGAYVRCMEELSGGNNEFLRGKARMEKTLSQYNKDGQYALYTDLKTEQIRELSDQLSQLSELLSQTAKIL